MRYSSAVLVLATAFIGNVVAGPVHAHQHQHFHEKKAELVNREPVGGGLANVDWAKIHYTYSSGQTWGQPTSAPAAVVAAVVPASTSAPAPTTASPSPSASASAPAPAAAAANVVEGLATTLTELSTSFLSALGVKSAASSGTCWVGTDGAWTIDFFNKAGVEVILSVWGPAASWVNANSPWVLVTIPAGGKTTVSLNNGASGAFAGIYPDTILQMGQVSNSWGEFTLSSGGVVDVSREVNMSGHPLSIQTPTGCVSDMNNCVFVCPPGSGNSCWQNYQLDQSSDPNCIKGYDPVMGGDSGGCSVGQTSGGKVTVTFG